MKRRVVITGMGVLSSVGFGCRAFWEGICAGRGGISTLERFDVSDLPTKVAAEIKSFEAEDYMSKKESRRMDLFTQYAMAATRMALEHAGLDLGRYDPYKVGVIIGSGVGGLETLEDQHSALIGKGVDRVSPFFIPMMIANMAAGRVAMEYGLKGFNECVITACASGNNAIGNAFRKIQWGVADAMVAGGSEAAITRLSFAGFCAAKAMSVNPDPGMAMRPFDADRDGFVMGEGAGILILEELGQALERGAEVYAEIVGYACTNDAYHITAPDPTGESGAKCLELAVADAGIERSEVGYVNAHGTSTPKNDVHETRIIKDFFGGHASRLAVGSTKSMTGHLLGAAGAVEAIVTAMALKDGFMPPTIGLRNADPECDLDYLPGEGRKADLKFAVSNALGFGGHNSMLVLRRYG
ncbi:MAG: beta-ketoacyl-ACP synthase II [Oscillospiraceae bacterium]|nr:beta-ketoacyl-ACP synthase II [Oscillospiraceae bacterium]